MKAESPTPITHISDTATWVATYRADESKRPDALFKDLLAEKLIDDIDQKALSKMFSSQWVRWSVVTRTVVIDQLILELVAQGVDTVLNLGAGLDTRPYRMNLPQHLKWIEVDFEKMIQRKTEKLRDEETKCQLQRHALDLSDRNSRLNFFAQIGSASKNVLVLTEGVIPYLSEQEVAELCEDLRTQPAFQYWIAEYLAPHLYAHFKHKKRVRQMQNAPFKFMPSDWYGHFKNNGWSVLSTRYLAEVSQQLGRPIPMPWWTIVFRMFANKKSAARFRQFSGFVVFSPTPQ